GGGALGDLRLAGPRAAAPRAEPRPAAAGRGGGCGQRSGLSSAEQPGWAAAEASRQL
ncbi:unnamed protein product, partial [Effrenium voratum]